MTFHLYRAFLASLALLGLVMVSRGGMTSYTERGNADFDMVMPLLNPYGTWSKIDGLWAYTPLDHQAPYTHGRWIYTEYGWYWKGSLPHSWVTEHYGYWKRSADKVWSWFPGPQWLPETVEIRATPTHIGWRSGAVDADGNFIEDPLERYTKTEEWTFVTLAQFANPITPAIAAKPDEVKDLLEISTDSHHSYLTYREIDRPGPHPADFVAFCKDGGMFAPKTVQDELAAQPAPPPPVIPGYTPAAMTNSPAAHMTGTNGPVLMGSDTDPAVDKRKVKYWITMSLPTYWTPRPPDAKPEEIYLYRPDFYQDNDGIERRIALWFNPKIRTTLKDVIGKETAEAKPGRPVTLPAIPASPAVPASAMEASPAQNPFRSPFDDSFHSDSAARDSSKTPAPSETNAPNSAIPSPLKNASN